MSAEPLASNQSADGSYGVEFFESPYRHYTIVPSTDGADAYKVPSVTTVIGVIDKSGPLQHYASNETLKGIATLARETRGRLPFPAAWGDLAEGETEPERVARIADGLKGSLRKRKLMFYNATDRAAKRGVDAHKVAEDWIERKVIPNLSDYPTETRGFIQSFAQWVTTVKPEFADTEMVVGSVKHGYAGRLDNTLALRVNGRTRLLDYKTAKRVYPRQHFPQLMAYEGARVEMGLEPTDEQSILRLRADGGMPQEVLVRDVTLDDFLRLLEAHKSQSAIPECSECWEVRCKCRRAK